MIGRLTPRTVRYITIHAQKIPPLRVGNNIWDERLADIARFEDYLTRQGVVILKFYLNLSYGEQKRRFMRQSSARNGRSPARANSLTISMSEHHLH